MRILLIGSTGRLGSAIQRLLPQDFTLVAAAARPPLPTCQADLLIAAGLGNPLPYALELQLPLILATTGLPDDAIASAAQQIPLFYDNYSLGIAVLRHLTREISRLFPAEIDLIESHHRHKKDAPSGTALLLANAIAEHQKKPAIHSIRSGETIGEHTIRFNTPSEELVLSHRAHTRDVYAHGIFRAARFLLGQPAGLYTLDHVLTSKESCNLRQ